MRVYPILLLVAGLSLSACDDPVGPSPGTLVVSTLTGGGDPDQDGFQLTVDGGDSLALVPTGTVEVDLSAGRHSLRLLGVADHCSVAPGTSLEVEVAPESTTPVAFEVSCPAIGARVTTTTTGLDIDQDGYRVAVDGGDRGAIPANGTALIRVDPGSRTITLTGLTSNCAVDGPHSRTVTVVATEIVPIEFVVACAATNPLLAFGSGGDIYFAHLDGSNLRRLTSDGSPNSYNLGAAWSPDGSRIAFFKLDGQTGAEIYVIDADGANPTRLSPEGTYDASPTWSPDGSRIAFENRADNRSGGHIFVMNADGANRVQLTSNRQPNSSPAWSPDGHRIAYATYSDSAGDSGTHIYVINADGTNRVRLTNDEAYDSDPEWSPDGSRIVFSRSGDPFVINADGTRLAPLTPAGSESGGSYDPAWSPDGLMIAFTRYTDCRVDPYGDPSCHVGIWVLRTAGGRMYELPLEVGLEKGPSWRP